MRLALVLKSLNNELNNLLTFLSLERSKLLVPNHLIRVNSFPNASGSQPKSNVKPNRISPAKGVNKLPVEDQPRTNMSHLRTSNHVDSSSCLKRITVPRTPRQNDVVERWNRTLVEVARIMLIFSKAPMFLWAEVVATACYTQNGSLIHTRHHKTPYELVHNKKPDLTFFKVFGALCYPTNDSEDLEKLQPTANTRIFVGYAPSMKGYRIYNKNPDESWKLFTPVLPSQAVQAPLNSAGTPSSTTIDQDAPSPNHTVALVYNNPFVNVFALEPHSKASSSGDISSTEST
nr:integrase, catalytic region, zinc finger, CCHC-type, peptidase aspartic, catalytic [Tanacetum cinerariifolium]